MSDKEIWIPHSKDETVVVLPKEGVDKLTAMLSDYCGWPISERDAIQTCCFLVELELLQEDDLKRIIAKIDRRIKNKEGKK